MAALTFNCMKLALEPGSLLDDLQNIDIVEHLDSVCEDEKLNTFTLVMQSNLRSFDDPLDCRNLWNFFLLDNRHIDPFLDGLDDKNFYG